VLPKNSIKPDYEAEFAVVIGRRGRHVAEDHWRDYVFGYTILNDVSARDFQMATSQWMIGKTFDTFAPIGPPSSPPTRSPTRTSSAFRSPSTAKPCRIRTPAT